MEKLPHQFSQESPSSNSNLWDCGSTLYDSFELNSFKRQLSSAIIIANNNSSRRTLSMSHLPERRLLPLQPLSQAVISNNKKHHYFNISRSFRKLLRFVFKSSNNKSTTVSSSSNSISFQVPEKYSKERVYVVYDKSGPVLSTIPEVPEFEIGAAANAISPEISSFVTSSASERFTTTALGISCA